MARSLGCPVQGSAKFSVIAAFRKRLLDIICFDTGRGKGFPRIDDGVEDMLPMKRCDCSEEMYTKVQSQQSSLLEHFTSPSPLTSATNNITAPIVTTSLFAIQSVGLKSSLTGVSRGGKEHHTLYITCGNTRHESETTHPGIKCDKQLISLSKCRSNSRRGILCDLHPVGTNNFELPTVLHTDQVAQAGPLINSQKQQPSIHSHAELDMYYRTG
eukprot:scaffold10663_cov203-Skeletonema_menzelii.AAC.4